MRVRAFRSRHSRGGLRRPTDVRRIPAARTRELISLFLFVFLRGAATGVGGAGGGLRGAPFIPLRLQLFHFGGLGGGEVFRFTDIGGEVVELG